MKQSQGVNLKCNSCSERTSHVGSLILLSEGLCAVLLHPLPKALSVQKEECPHREQIAFPGYFTMLRSPWRCTWFHVPMNVAGACPSACSSIVLVWGGMLCDGQLVRLCLLYPARCSMHLSFAWSYGSGLRNPRGLELLSVLLVLQFGILHQYSRFSWCVLAAEELLWDHVYIHVLFFFIWNHQANLCAEYDCYLNIVEHENKKNPSVLQRDSVKNRLCN